MERSRNPIFLILQSFFCSHQTTRAGKALRSIEPCRRLSKLPRLQLKNSQTAAGLLNRETQRGFDFLGLLQAALLFGCVFSWTVNEDKNPHSNARLLFSLPRWIPRDANNTLNRWLCSWAQKNGTNRSWTSVFIQGFKLSGRKKGEVKLNQSERFAADCRTRREVMWRNKESIYFKSRFRKQTRI